jgi:hypothetical protein
MHFRKDDTMEESECTALVFGTLQNMIADMNDAQIERLLAEEWNRMAAFGIRTPGEFETAFARRVAKRMRTMAREERDAAPRKRKALPPVHPCA